MDQDRTIRDLLTQPVEGYSTAFEVVRELEGDGIPRTSLVIERRKLQPEPVKERARSESSPRAHTFFAVSGFLAYLRNHDLGRARDLGEEEDELAAVWLDDRSPVHSHVVEQVLEQDALAVQAAPRLPAGVDLRAKADDLAATISGLVEHRLNALALDVGEEDGVLAAELREHQRRHGHHHDQGRRRHEHGPRHPARCDLGLRADLGRPGAQRDRSGPRAQREAGRDRGLRPALQRRHSRRRGGRLRRDRRPAPQRARRGRPLHRDPRAALRALLVPGRRLETHGRRAVRKTSGNRHL